MEIFICDECNTLASVEMRGNTLVVNACKCQTNTLN
jgi:hypothetical protein